MCVFIWRPPSSSSSLSSSGGDVALVEIGRRGLALSIWPWRWYKSPQSDINPPSFPSPAVLCRTANIANAQGEIAVWVLFSNIIACTTVMTEPLDDLQMTIYIWLRKSLESIPPNLFFDNRHHENKINTGTFLNFPRGKNKAWELATSNHTYGPYL